MTDGRKTKRQLVAELEEMRRQVAELRGRLQLLEGEGTFERMRATQLLHALNKAQLLDRAQQEIVKRTRAEEALKESEMKLRLIFENAFDGISIYEEFPDRREHRLLDCNERYAEMSGRSKKELLEIGNTVLVQKRVSPARSRQESLQLRREKRSYQGVFSWIRPDGQENIIEYSASPVQVGELSLSIGVDRDITERVRAEKALRESETRLRALSDATFEGIAFTEQGVLIDANQQFADMLAYEMDQVLGMDVRDLVAPEDRELVRNKILTGSQEPYEHRALCQDGTIIHVEIRPRMMNVEGRPVRVTAVRDITERVRAEEALRQSEERYRLLFNNVTDVVFVHPLSPDGEPGKLIEVNDVACRRLGYTREELLDLTPAELVHPMSLGNAPALGEQLLADRRAVFERVLEARDGTQIPVEIGAHLFDLDGQPTVLSVARDVTERKRTEEAMLQASRLEATATLAGGIAHDFNNLMVGVLGYAEMLKMDLGGRKDELEMLDVISESARRASKLAQQMLAFARGGRYRPQAMDLNDTIQRVLSAQERSLPPRIRILFDADPDLWEVEADLAQMNEVVLNLLTNAVEAVEGDGRITISTSNRALNEGDVADLSPGRYVCLSVRDTGHGMSQEVQARIFEPFFTTKVQGRGMGLAAVYGIVENHGGHIAVQSEQGQGATLTVYLPAICVAGTEPAKTASAAKPDRDVALAVLATVLVVEGDESVLKLTQRMLERMGCRTLAARSRQEAIDIARAFDGEIHLALLDMETSGVDRTETYPLLVEARPRMKVVLCSGYELDTRAQVLLDAGASAFIKKPFQMSVFEAEIRKALKE